jgi:hypothetical protein
MSSNGPIRPFSEFQAPRYSDPASIRFHHRQVSSQLLTLPLLGLPQEVNEILSAAEDLGER